MPEQVRSFEIGYKGLFFNSVYLLMQKFILPTIIALLRKQIWTCLKHPWQIQSLFIYTTNVTQSIKDELQLTALVSISINKFVAKIASDMDKPNGLTFIGLHKLSASWKKSQLKFLWRRESDDRQKA